MIRFYKSMREKGFALLIFLIIVALLGIGLLVFLKKDSFLLQQKVVWSQNLETKDITRSASLYARGDLIYVISYYGPFLLEIDSSSGQIKREFRVGEKIMSSDLSDNFFFYNDGNYKINNIHALDLSTGVEKWSKKIESPGEKYAYLKAVMGKVYLNEGLGKVVALNGENGEELWTFETNLPTNIPSGTINEAPLIRTGNSIVVLGFYGGMVHALNPESGKEIWKFNSGSVVRPEEILVTDKNVYVASYRTTGDIVYALDTETGEVKWQFSTEGNPNTSMTFDGETFYLAKAYGYLYAVNSRDGKELWRIKTDNFPTQLVISDNRIYFGKIEYRDPFPARGHVYAVDRKSGKQIWHYETQDTISDVATTNGIGYFFVSNGELIAIK